MAEPRTSVATKSAGEAANAGITLCEVRFSHAWEVRADAARAPFVEQAHAVLGMPPPMQPSRSAVAGDRALLRMGPRSWLLLAGSSPGEFAHARDTLNASGGALFDVSAGYVAWYLSGRAAASVLNRACPLDLHASAFPAGACTQSLVGHVSAVVCRPAEAPAFMVLVPRSLAPHAWHLLCECAESERYVVGEPMALGDVLLRRPGPG